MKRVDKYMANCRRNVAVREISGEEAVQAILSDESPGVVPVTCDTELSRLGLNLNDTIEVIPDDTGRVISSTLLNHSDSFEGKDGVTLGALLCVNRKETVVQIKGAHGSIRVHFPRVGYVVTKPMTLARL